MAYIQSFQEADEEFVCETHTSVCAALNAMSGGKCLWLGENRRKLKELKALLDSMIAGDTPIGSKYAVCRLYCTAIG
jgi:hypothetical protein